MPDVHPEGPVPAAPASYRALLAIPSLARALGGMQVARIAGSMLGVAIVLFSLAEYRSPGIAGLITFTTIFPGLLVSPIAGALLDRHGRIRLIVIDFIVAMVSLVLIGTLSLLDLLELPILLAIAALASLTGPLSNAGLRTLFPLMVPRHLWERLNAVDSNGWILASIVGPPIAAIAVGLVGGAWAVILIGTLFGVAALVVAAVPDPPLPPGTDASGRLVADAWQGLRYAWGNRTIRGLGFSLSILNVGGGMLSIVIPLIVLERLGLDEAFVGIAFAVQGITGVVVGLLAGRIDTRGRERRLVTLPMFLYAPLCGFLVVGFGLPGLLVTMGLMGLLTGPMDVALFTLRQRRTDPAWMGRAFAVSMAFNFSGYPIGAAIGGAIAGWSLDAALLVAAAAALVAGTVGLLGIPERAEEFDGRPPDATGVATGTAARSEGTA